MCHVDTVIYFALRPACLYNYKTLANENKLACVYTFPSVPVCTRWNHRSKLCGLNITLYFSHLNLHFRSTFPRVLDVIVFILRSGSV